MQRLEVSGAVRPIYGSLGIKWLTLFPVPVLSYQLKINVYQNVKKKYIFLWGICCTSTRTVKSVAECHQTQNVKKMW